MDTPLACPYQLDDELAIRLLDGRVPAAVQAEVELAKQRLDLAAIHGLSPKAAGWLVGVLAHAGKAGRLGWRTRTMNYCRLCGARGRFAVYKSGPRKGEPNLAKPIPLAGVDLEASPTVVMTGHISVGACKACVTAHQGLLRVLLAGREVELPAQLGTPGATRWKWSQRRRCTRCGWEGCDAQMRRERTLLGDGTYPAGCPECDAVNRPFAASQVEIVDGFVLLDDGVWLEPAPAAPSR